MIKVFKSLIIIIFFSTITIHANSETSWITKKDGNKCRWTNYSDYLKYKNTQLIVQDIDGTHESLTGNSNNINL